MVGVWGDLLFSRSKVKLIDTLGEPVGVRGLVQEDIPFITSTWLHGYKASPSCIDIPNGSYFDKEHRLIQDCFRRRDTVTIVITDPTDTNSIFGYLIGASRISGPRLHWIYVKKGIRRNGVGTLMLEMLIGLAGGKREIILTHLSEDIQYLEHLAEFSYQPIYYGKGIEYVPASK